MKKKMTINDIIMKWHLKWDKMEMTFFIKKNAMMKMN